MEKTAQKLILGGALLVGITLGLGFFAAPPRAQAEENCVIKEVRFRPNGVQGKDWYKDNGAIVWVYINSENCADKMIEFSIISPPPYSDNGINKKKIKVLGDYFFIKLLAGDKGCNPDGKPWCNYSAKIHKTDGGDSQDFISQDKNEGKLMWNLCDGACYTEWGFLMTKKLSEEDWITLLSGPAETPLPDYVLLEPLPDLTTIDTTETEAPLADYINKLFAVAIGAAGVLAVLMLVISGIRYMMTESVFEKSEAKAGIGNALLGLFLALGAVVILTTINPDLINLNLRVEKASISIEDYAPGDTSAAVVTGDILSNFTAIGVTSCTKNGGGEQLVKIVNDLSNSKVTYSWGGKGGKTINSTIAFDCSGFVEAVSWCSGLPASPGRGTGDIFAGAEAISPSDISSDGKKIKNVELKIGDKVGWTQIGTKGQPGFKAGHVLIYIGNGKITDSHGPSFEDPKKGGEKVIGKALSTYDLASYRLKNKLKYVKRI